MGPPVIIKKFRTSQNTSMPTIQCKREFNLPHKFPSKLPEKCNYVQKRKNETNIDINSMLHQNFKNLKDNKLLSTNNIKKLRIRSQDGKDLGEVKVQFLSKGNILSPNTITFGNINMNHKINKPIRLSIMPSCNTGILMSSVNPQNDTERPTLATKSIFTNNVSTDSDEQSKLTNKSNVVQKQHVSANVNKSKQCNDQVILSKENDHNVQTSNKDITKFMTIQKSKMLLTDKIQSNNPIIRMQNKCSSKNEDLKDNTIKHQSRVNMSKIQNNLNSTKHWKLAESKFPVVKCEKLSVLKNKINSNEITRSLKSSPDLKNTIVKKNINSSRNLCSIKPNSNEEFDINVSLDLINPTHKSVNGTSESYENSNIIVIKRLDRDFNVLSRNDEYLCNEKQNNTNSTHSKMNSHQYEVATKDRSMCYKDLNFDTHNNTNNDKQATFNTVSNQERLSQPWNIIKEALISVKDEELRAKALKALADCGIGIAKQVPVSPPEKLKTVHDSPIQTDVFGLLDMGNFILVKEDTPILGKLKETEYSTLKSITVDAVTQTHTQIQVQHNVNVNKHIDNINLLPNLTSVSMQATTDLDNYFNEYFSTNTDVNRIKNILSTPHSLYKKVSVQLEIDYEGMRQWDENGMLNIHRAVINNQLREVQRLLLVLQASNTDIDIPTNDGMTCLELAIKSNASEDIVKMLLKAGAKPISSELLHESAILLSSKFSSPLLPDLLKYVTDPKLLNQVDSLGFAPLHYCALNGNIEGVTTLIEAGADINLKDSRSGRTALFHAVENNYLLIAQKLLENGAVANIPNFSGQTILALIDESKSLFIKTALKHVVI